MSPKSTSKLNKPIFQSYFWPAFLALFMAIVLSQWAVATPQADQDQIEAPPIESPLELPETENSSIDAEGSEDATPLTSKPEPISELEPAEQNNTQFMYEIPLSEKCYEQKDGSFECVCEGKEECETLKTAEHCEPETHWGKDGYGGCTKKPE